MPQKQYNKETTTEKKQEDWMNSKWRPMMGWMYMAICLFDFMLAPILWSVLQAVGHGGVTTQWQPLTLQGAGLFHVAMGAVIGISAYGRTQEKLNGAEAGGLGAGTTYVPPGGIQGGMGMNSGFNGASTGGFSSPAPAFGSAPAATGGFGSNFTSGSSASPAPQAPAVSVVNVTENVTDIQVNAKGKKVVPKFSQPEL